MKNTFIPTKIIAISKWWKKSKLKEDKGGSFNMELYLRILEIKSL